MEYEFEYRPFAEGAASGGSFPSGGRQPAEVLSLSGLTPNPDRHSEGYSMIRHSREGGNPAYSEPRTL